MYLRTSFLITQPTQLCVLTLALIKRKENQSKVKNNEEKTKNTKAK